MEITSYALALERLALRPQYYEVISLGRESPGPRRCRRHLWLDFDDQLGRGDALPGEPPDVREPQPQHVLAAVGFARGVPDHERLLIHCQAGLSHSTAIGWCILLDRLKDPLAAAEAVFALRPDAVPNPLLVWHGLSVLTGSVRKYDAIRARMRVLSTHPRKHLFL